MNKKEHLYIYYTDLQTFKEINDYNINEIHSQDPPNNEPVYPDDGPVYPENVNQLVLHNNNTNYHNIDTGMYIINILFNLMLLLCIIECCRNIYLRCEMNTNRNNESRQGSRENLLMMYYLDGVRIIM